MHQHDATQGNPVHLLALYSPNDVEDESSEIGSLAIKVSKIRNLWDVLSLVGWHDTYNEKGDPLREAGREGGCATWPWENGWANRPAR